MKIIVDENNPEDQAKMYGLKPRQCGNGLTRLRFQMAFIESQYLGEPVEYEFGFDLVDVGDIINK